MGEEKKKALIIGINKYDDHGFHDLDYAEKDAEEVYRALTDPQIGVFREADVILFTPKNLKVTKAEVEQKLEEIFLTAGKDDVVLVYFAGHGKLDKSGNLCLAAQDTRIDRIVSSSIRPEIVRSIVEQSPCKHGIFIIDSCYSGAAGQSSRSAEAVTQSLEKISGQGTITISASQAFEEAVERDDIGQGIFTHFLVKGLEEEEIDYDRDGFISVDELYEYVQKHVIDETKGKQVPAKRGTVDGKIIIARSSKFIRERDTEIKGLMNRAGEWLEKGKLDGAFDEWRKVLKRDAKNEDALLNMKNLIEDIRPKLMNYQLDQEEKLDTDIYNKANKILKKAYVVLTDQEKAYLRLLASLLSGLERENFTELWITAETREQRLKQEEEDRAKKIEEERKEQMREPSREPKFLDTAQPISVSASLQELKPGPSRQPLHNGERRAVNAARIFVSYSHSHTDKKLMGELKMMLKPLMDKSVISLWDDSQIPAGAIWRDEIKKALDTSDAALLLVSKNFLASEFITNNELPPLLEAARGKGLRILWVLLSDCDYKTVKEIESYQAAHDISRPLNKLSPSDRDTVLVKICEEIKKAAGILALRTRP
jgi:uncharacterized caspase-like protein